MSETTHRKPSSSRTELWLLALVGAFVFLFAALMFFSPGPAALADYIDWTYQGVLFRDVLRGHPDTAYLLKNYPVPNSLTTFGLGFLMLILPWKIAAKIWLVLGIVLGLVSGYRLQKASGTQQNWKILVLLATGILGISFWCGFENFLLGTYLVCLMISFLLENVTSRWLYASLLVLIFFTHMIPFGFALFVLLLYVWQQKRWTLLWQPIPSLALCVWYFLGRSAHGNADVYAALGDAVPYLSPAFVAFRVNTYLKCWGFVNMASTFEDSVLLRLVGTKLFVLLFVFNAIIAIAMFVLLARAAYAAWKERTHQRFFWIAATVFFGAALVMPQAAAGISDPGGRMLQVAVCCALCMVATRRQWTGYALAACAVPLLIAGAYQMKDVALQPPMAGTATGPLPARIRQFGHVVYPARWPEFLAIDSGNMTSDIYPTGLFLKEPAAPSSANR